MNAQIFSGSADHQTEPKEICHEQKSISSSTNNLHKFETYVDQRFLSVRLQDTVQKLDDLSSLRRLRVLILDCLDPGWNKRPSDDDLSAGLFKPSSDSVRRFWLIALRGTEYDTIAVSEEPDRGDIS